MIDDIYRQACVAAGPLKSFDPAIDRDDLRQQAALGLLRCKESIASHRVMRARRIAQELLQSAQVRRRRQTETLGFDVGRKKDDPADEAELAEFRQLALRAKCYGQAKVLSLIFEGYTPAEIARLQGRSLPSVQNTIAAAVHRLREVYSTGVSGDARLGRCRQSSHTEASQ